MKKIIALILSVLLFVLVFAGCSKDENKITVAASPTPHAEILKQCVDKMEEKGYKLVIKEMEDYVIPNTSTEEGEVDANFFQHTPYLNTFNEENNTHLVSVVKVHYEPLGIYSGKAKSFDDLKSGDEIAVPNDTSNEARALLLLEANGIIKLKENAGLTASVRDITDNPKGVKIVEMEAALIPGSLDSLALGVINGNYAIGAGLDVSKTLAHEESDSEAAQLYANVLVVKEGNENNEAIKALAEILTSKEIKDYIEKNYNGAVVPMK